MALAELTITVAVGVVAAVSVVNDQSVCSRLHETTRKIRKGSFSILHLRKRKRISASRHNPGRGLATSAFKRRTTAVHRVR